MAEVGTLFISCPCCKRKLMVQVKKEKVKEPEYELFADVTPLQKDLLGKESPVGDLKDHKTFIKEQEKTEKKKVEEKKLKDLPKKKDKNPIKKDKPKKK